MLESVRHGLLCHRLIMIIYLPFVINLLFSDLDGSLPYGLWSLQTSARASGRERERICTVYVLGGGRVMIDNSRGIKPRVTSEAPDPTPGPHLDRLPAHSSHATHRMGGGGVMNPGLRLAGRSRVLIAGKIV